MRRILNVAEKPSAAKEITKFLSRGASRTIPSKSKYNPVYEFRYEFQGQEVIMNFTSVTGHLISLEFEEKYGKKNWSRVAPSDLFKVARIQKYVDQEKTPLQQNLVNLARNCHAVILWLDCDREGEAIAFEVLEICQSVNRNIGVYRAQFSAFTKRDIEGAMLNLRDPDANLAAAVESRQEIDLRIGSAFTRFQTTLIQRKLPSLATKVISYGPCQFPTLGFVVEKYKKVQSFVPENFWFIQVKHEKVNKLKAKDVAEFLWDRKQLFDRDSALILYDKVMESPTATVIEVAGVEKARWRPAPLSTIAMQKLATSKLRLPSHRVMEIAEKLYNKGFISYPRTETDSFTTNMNIRGMVDLQRAHPMWGDYATNLMTNNKFQWPRNGGHDDKAHPPIHPVKVATKDNDGLNFDEWRIYELVARHFLACCSKDARGFETTIRIEIQMEFFHARGLMIKELNWLEVYPYERWTGNVVPEYQVGEKFRPTALNFQQSTTTRPNPLTENELIGLMDKNGIGTDATIHEHIKTIQERNYCKKEGLYFIPTTLGIALIDAYDKMGIDLWKPFLRASMEANMTKISRGALSKDAFLEGCLTEMESIYESMMQKQDIMIEVMREKFGGDVPINAGAMNNLEGDIDPSNFRVSNDQEGICGNCQTRGLRVMEDQQGTKIVRCEPCDSVLKLPRKGTFNFDERACPLCNFQVIQVTTETNTRYNLCPMCYTHPPEALFEDAANEMMNQMPCFKCPSTDCSLAQGANNRPIMPCPKCKTNNMLIKKNKNGKYFLACSDNQRCKHIINVPACIKEAYVTNQVCPKCNANRVKLKFDESEILPSEIMMRVHEDNSMFCFGPHCDPDIESLGYQNDFGGGNFSRPSQQINVQYQQNQPSQIRTNQTQVHVPMNQIAPKPQQNSNQFNFNTFNAGNVNNFNGNTQIRTQSSANNSRIVPEASQNTQRGVEPPRSQSSVNSILQKYTNLGNNPPIQNNRPGLASDSMVGRIQANEFRTEIVAAEPSSGTSGAGKFSFCTKCKKVGHLASACPQNSGSKSQSGPNPASPSPALQTNNESSFSGRSNTPTTISKPLNTLTQVQNNQTQAQNQIRPQATQATQAQNFNQRPLPTQTQSTQNQPKPTQTQNPNYTSFASVSSSVNNKPVSEPGIVEPVCIKCKRTGHFVQNCPGFFGPGLKSGGSNPTNTSIASRSTNQNSDMGELIESRPAPKASNPTIQSKLPKPYQIAQPRDPNYEEEKENSNFESFGNKNAGSYFQTGRSGNTNNFNNFSSTNDNMPKKGTCYTCGEEGHWSSACPKKGQKSLNTGGSSFNAGGGSSYSGGGGGLASYNKGGSGGGTGGGTGFKSGGTVTCYKCKEEGHIAPKCPNAYKPGNEGGAGPGGTSFSSAAGSFGGSSNISCYKCKEPGHIAPNCPNGTVTVGKGDFPYSSYGGGDGEDGPKTGTCFKCGESGHWANKCPQNNGGSSFGGNYGGGGANKTKRNDGDGGKSCGMCGHVGRHPRGSECPSIKRKQVKKTNDGGEGNYGDYE